MDIFYLFLIYIYFMFLKNNLKNSKILYKNYYHFPVLKIENQKHIS